MAKSQSARRPVPRRRRRALMTAVGVLDVAGPVAAPLTTQATGGSTSPDSAVEHGAHRTTSDGSYNEAPHEAPAELVKYLADRFRTPLDRQHINGYDNVVNPNSASACVGARPM
ncbi:hypothetical protein ACFRDV_13000 [Streptomyces fagopyri]|uniref:hypothetical protein n=1 Tax=Streptomyces fagopyri TaxID=2662397 RepID=UPI003676BEA6